MNKEKRVSEIILEAEAQVSALLGRPVKLREKKGGLNPDGERIIGIIEKITNVKLAALIPKNRSAEMRVPRQLIAYYLYERASMTLPSISEMIQRDHTSVIHSIRTVKNMRRNDDALYMQYINQIDTILGE